MRILIVIFLFPFISFSQDQQFAEDNCEAWIKNRMKDDSSSYKSIFFSKLEPNNSIPNEGIELINKIILQKYQLFELRLGSSVTSSSYKDQVEKLDEQIRVLEVDQLIISGYKLRHKFLSKADNGCRVYYEVSYELDDLFQVIESVTERKVDCANADF